MGRDERVLSKECMNPEFKTTLRILAKNWGPKGNQQMALGTLRRLIAIIGPGIDERHYTEILNAPELAGILLSRKARREILQSLYFGAVLHYDDGDLPIYEDARQKQLAKYRQRLRRVLPKPKFKCGERVKSKTRGYLGEILRIVDMNPEDVVRKGYLYEVVSGRGPLVTLKEDELVLAPENLGTSRQDEEVPGYPGLRVSRGRRKVSEVGEG